jgi:hypothetical protein
MCNPIPPCDPRTTPPDRETRETGTKRPNQAAADLGYLPASVRDYDHLTLEQWIDLCA